MPGVVLPEGQADPGGRRLESARASVHHVPGAKEIAPQQQPPPDSQLETIERRARELEDRLGALEAEAVEARGVAEGLLLRAAAVEQAAAVLDHHADDLAARLDQGEVAAAELETAKARAEATAAVLRADLERAQRLLAERAETLEHLVRERDAARAGAEARVAEAEEARAAAETRADELAKLLAEGNGNAEALATAGAAAEAASPPAAPESGDEVAAATASPPRRLPRLVPAIRRRRAAPLEPERVEREQAEPAADAARPRRAPESAARSPNGTPAEWVVGLALLALGVVLLLLVLSGALGALL